MARTNLFLRQAIAVLNAQAEFSPKANAEDAWSSTYLPLAALLGKPLTELLRNSGELQNDFVYSGEAYSWHEGARNEHVVPMRCIVQHLISTPELWSGSEGVPRLRDFLSSHLVLARVPKILDTELKRQAMPNDVWHRQVGLCESIEQKNEFIWARYIATGKLRMHWQERPNFLRVKT